MNDSFMSPDDVNESFTSSGDPRRHRRMLINAVPQRQGAVGPRAAELPEGCLALAELAGHVLGRPVHHVRQVTSVSEVDRGIASRAILTGPNRAAQLAALEAPGGPVLTIGGDCGAELVPIGVARFRYGPGLAAVGRLLVSVQSG